MMVLAFLLSLCSEADAFIKPPCPALALLQSWPFSSSAPWSISKSTDDEEPFYQQFILFNSSAWLRWWFWFIVWWLEVLDTSILILVGYFEMTMYLYVTGKLDQYINLHYSYSSLSFYVFWPLYFAIDHSSFGWKNEGTQPLTNQDSPVHKPGPTLDSSLGVAWLFRHRLGCDNGGIQGISLSLVRRWMIRPATRRHQRPVSQTR